MKTPKPNERLHTTGILILAAILLVCIFSPPVHGLQKIMPEEQVSEATSFDPEKVQKRIAEIEKITESEEPANSQQTALPQTLVAEPAIRPEADNTLQELKAVYKRLLTARETRESLQKELTNLNGEIKSKMDGLPAEPAPYNLSEYDNLLDQLATLDKEEQTLQTKLISEKNALEEKRTALEMVRKKVRTLTEDLQNSAASDTGRPTMLIGQNLVRAKLEEEILQAFVDLTKMLIENAEIGQKIVLLKKERTKRRADWVRAKLAFDPYDLGKQLAALEERRLILQARIERLKEEQEDVEVTWLKAGKTFEEAQSPEEAAKAKTHLEAREAWRKTYQQVLEQTENMLILLNREKQLWQNRYALLDKKFEYAELDTLQREGNDNIKNIERLVSVNEKYQSELQAEIAAIQKKMEEDEDPEIKQNIAAQEAAFRKMAERIFEYLSLLQNAQRSEQRFVQEISRIKNDLAFEQKIRQTWTKLATIWDFELWVVDDRSVTVKKVIVALFILIIGMLLARSMTRRAIRPLLMRSRLDDSGTAAVEKTLHSLVLLALIIFALRSVNIPITIFTYLGGAIAIGAGFGAQNLLNNFISGFILLIERPVKINDLIEVDSNFGIIEKIGMRCTRVRTPGNIHFLVPNSIFLEKNIVNWTLSDQKIRAKVTVGVAHGTSPSEVSRLMIKAVYEHRKVLAEPPPVVLFDDIGENSLLFVIYFWISMKSLYLLERRVIESDVRFRMIDLFYEAGIVVAHPQRDVHLNSETPLEMRLIRPQRNER